MKNLRRNVVQYQQRLWPSDAGVTMLEAAIALPVFFALIYAIFSLHNVTTKYSALATALNRAAHAFQGVSAQKQITELQAFQYAGNVFWDQAQALGLSTDEVIYDPAASGAAFVLVGAPITLPTRCGDGPPLVYELKAKLRPKNLFSQIFVNLRDLYLSDLGVVETGNSVTGTINGQVTVYSPSLALGSRVRRVAQSSVPNFP